MRSVSFGAFALLGVGVIVVSTALAVDDPEKAAPSKLDPLMKLVGTWVQVEDGKPTDVVLSKVRLTAGGSVLIEELFPGTDHEMVSMIQTDGKDVILTHYCVLGNAPRMKLDVGADKNTWTWTCDCKGVNVDAKTPHMHQGVVRWKDDDHFQSEWTLYSDGKPDPSHQATFDAMRKK